MVIENGLWYSLCKYLKPLMHLRYLQYFQGEDAVASSRLGIQVFHMRQKVRPGAIRAIFHSGQ
ncbi:hypothetical protein DXT89_13810 [Agrobacterium vitis]|uniref:Uncharacterized protein n=1 Tax=Agrobacterium vitis TaxID=373 RepID=A0A368NTZ3_AGRVI|nr:hypothetical protein DXM22_07815 [Agrobacterium vitis]KAA3527007.1 hypothetical protein DXT89_13810 [Agrobacterium vitis]RCU53194.1 hypothetical protein ASB66_016140 [Agrobacterium vitis]